MDIIECLSSYTANVEVFDPWVNPEEAKSILGIEMLDSLKPGRYDSIIVCVGHSEFKEMGIKKLRYLCQESNVIFDVKGVFHKGDVDGRL